MPKLDFKELSNWIGLIAKNKDSIDANMDKLLEEQGNEFAVFLGIAGLKNINAFNGALAMYFTIREAIIKQECQQLENLVK